MCAMYVLLVRPPGFSLCDLGCRTLQPLCESDLRASVRTEVSPCGRCVGLSLLQIGALHRARVWWRSFADTPPFGASDSWLHLCWPSLFLGLGHRPTLDNPQPDPPILRWTPLRRTAQHFVLCFPSHAPNSTISSFCGRLLVEFRWCLRWWCPPKCTFQVH